MPTLELRIPPPLVGLVTAGVMWLLSLVLPPVAVAAFPRIPIALLIAAIGGAFDIAGVLAFRRAQTTPNPMRPDKASSLVTSGVYRITRNPMYLGLLCLLLAWAAFLAAPLSLAGVVAFVAYMNRFQIRPEERALSARFGDEYIRYMARVRRWL